MKKTILIALILLSIPLKVNAACPDANIFSERLITGVCWNCFFPFRLFGTTKGDGTIPSGAAKEVVCSCPTPTGIPDVGLVSGFFNPLRAVEIVREPYCSPTLGGIRVNDGYFNQGTQRAYEGDGVEEGGFYHYHYLAFPIFAMLELFDIPACNEDGFDDFDVLYLSELDVTWNDELLGFLLIPETLIFANPFAQIAMTVDCVASSLGHTINSMFFSAGCWGSMYPFSGYTNSSSVVEGTSLLTARAMAALHRRGFAKQTMGRDALCGAYYMPTISKNTYRFSMLYPIPESSGPIEGTNNNVADGDVGDGNGEQGTVGEDTAASVEGTTLDASDVEQDKCCHPIGATSWGWGEWRTQPYKEDFVYSIWKYQDCCVR